MIGMTLASTAVAILPGSALEKSQQRVARLEARCADARKALDEATQRHTAAVIALDDGNEGAAKALKEARSALEAAQRELSEAEIGLTGARARHDELIAKETQRSESERWAEIERMVKERDKRAANADRLLRELVAEVNEITRLGEQAYFAAPRHGATIHDDFLSAEQTNDALRRAFRKHGAVWAFSGPFSDEFREFSALIADANKMLLLHRDGRQQ